MRVRDVLEYYSLEPVVVSPETKVSHAIKLLTEKARSALIIVDSGGSLIGLFTDRDFSKQFVTNKNFELDTPVCEIMSAPVICVDMNMSSSECLKVLYENNIRHLGVVNNEGAPIGVVTALDIVQSLLNERNRKVKELEAYDPSAKWPF